MHETCDYIQCPDCIGIPMPLRRTITRVFPKEKSHEMDIMINALKEIASCEITIDGDCPSIAQKALRLINEPI